MDDLTQQKLISDICENQKRVCGLDSDNHTLADFVSMQDEDLFAKTRACYAYIEDWKNKGTYNLRRKICSKCDNRVMVSDGSSNVQRSMIMMSSNSYLGLTSHPKVIEAGQKAISKYGGGMSGSPVLNGTFDLLKELEERLAVLKGCEEAMVFSTGYSANLGAIAGLIRPKDVVLLDRLDHASIIDGCKLAGGNFRTFKHNNMQSLEKQLELCSDKFEGKLIAVDGVFSMDGDIVFLPEILKLAECYGAKVMVDEAHATGVLGAHGRGTSECFGLEGKVDMEMGTFSKALGATGGFIASTKEVITYLRHYARSYTFSASITPSVVATVLAGLDVLREEPERREKLWSNIHYMHDNLKALGYDVYPSPPESAILIITIGNEVKLRQMSRRIHELGVFLSDVPYPAVPKDKGRFRFSLMATHTLDDLDETLDVLKTVGREFEVI
ncbi:MAG: aminotransferase class I/II-fold pyridoxal phosphate-dependent enzyme [Candidatus Omnitrophota bacterium]|nr:aminotransferase class I/II-fold pyridoxal phosphate-dependent enzyme [Candidatus Omnitrophota bacterium]